MKFKTNASHAEKQINKMMKDQVNMPTEWHYLDGSINSVLLETTLDEVGLYFEVPPFIRPGYMAENSKTTFPTLFAKINGSTNFGFNYKKKKLDHILYLHDQTLWDFQKNFKVDIPSNILDDNLIDFKEAYRLFDKKLTGMKLTIQDHFIDMLNFLFSDYKTVFMDKYVNITQHDILKSIMRINQKYFVLLNNMDMSYTAPKLIIDLKKKTLDLENSIGLLFLNLLGYDIVVIHETGLTDIENYVQPAYINVFHIDKMNGQSHKSSYF